MGVACSCLISERVSAPCAVCGEHPEKVHIHTDSVTKFYCPDHCPICGFGDDLAGEVITIRGKQQGLFGTEAA